MAIQRSRDTVSVVIPAKNEARNVGWVLERLPKQLEEVILVDGDSRDSTVDVARASYPGITIVRERGRGKGAAMRTGMQQARGDVIVLIDADGSMDPHEINRFIEKGATADLVKGSRFAARGGSYDISPLRRLGNGALRVLVNVLYGATLTDLCYGYCAVRREALSAMALRSDGFEIETEMTVRALRARLRITEVPSFEAPRRHGASNLRTFRDGSRVLRTLLLVRMRSPPPRPAPVAAVPAPPPPPRGNPSKDAPPSPRRRGMVAPEHAMSITPASSSAGAESVNPRPARGG